jgi:undecaprenyl-diphosphatase
MTFLDAILLGLVQGLTEFLPVSSTGHLVLMREVLGLQTEHGLAVDATFHFATAFAVLIYFRKDIYELALGFIQKLQGKVIEPHTNTLIWALILGTVPGVVAGLLLEESIDTVFRSPHLIAWVLILGSVLFLVAEYVTKKMSAHTELTVHKGVAVGFFQVLALIPGMSRSGATISGGMLMGLTREKAARFAFLLSFPIILGAGSKKLLELSTVGMGGYEWLVIAVGASTAFTSGLLCVHFLLRFLKNHTLHVFVVYRIALALLVLYLL